jgi:uncharacterized protein (TIGR02145 family)
VSGGLEESITNLGIASKASSQEVIGGKTYYYTTIGGNDWMMTNIADPAAGAPFRNCTAMSEVFGRYYSYKEALAVCPEGWTLPSEADWMALATAAGAEDVEAYGNIGGVAAALMGNAYFNDELMWEYWPAVGEITNASGLSIIPAGFAMLSGKNAEGYYSKAIFKGYLDYAVFWTADTVEGEEDMAYYRYIIGNQPEFMLGKGDVTSYGASVRCVR